MKILKLLFPFILFSVSAQNTINPNTGDAYLLFGPNSGWGEYFQVGGNGRATTNAGIFATNGNLHLDAKDGPFMTYINHYSKGNTLINPQGGSVGIGLTNPVKPLHIVSSSEHHQIRLQGQDDKHTWIQFYPSGTNTINWQIGANDNGFSIYDVTSSSYKFTVNNSGKIGMGTNSPSAQLEIKGASETDINDLLVHSTSSTTNIAGWARIGLKRTNDPDQGFLSFYGNASSGLILGVTGNNPIRFYNDDSESVRIKANGNVGIGTTSPDAKLTVKGRIHTEEVKVDLAVPAPDYVFKEGYDLKSLEEVQNYIQEHGHLPNIPSAKELEANGIQLGKMDMKLLQKIEELTLYILSQEKKLLLKDGQIAALYNLVHHQEKRLKKLEDLLKANEP